MKLKILVGFILVSSPVFSEENLEKKLEELSLPANQAPVPKLDEKLYAVQNRFVPVDLGSEFKLMGGMNFTPDNLVDSKELSLSYRFHLDERWHFTASGSYVFNKLSDGGEKLRQLQRLVPDSGWVKYRADVLTGYNTFYGKFRVNMDKVFYFDQYFAAGPGIVVMDSGSSIAAVGDLGFVFWFGRKLNVQIGLKDYFYEQKRKLSKSYVNDLIGHFDIGFLFGGASS